MRMNLPSAILLSGTMMLFNSASSFAQTADVEKPSETEATVKTTETKATTEVKTEAASGDSVEKKTAVGDAGEKKVDGDAKVQANGPWSPAAKQPGRMQGTFFKFGKEAEKDAISDAPEAVEKARQLHAKAMEQSKTDIPAAIATEKEAIAAAEHFWLPHAGMVYLMMQDKSKKRPMDALKEVSLSLYGKHDTIAERNASKVFTMIHWTQPAQKALESAIEYNPNDEFARFALADMFISQSKLPEARKILEEIKPESISTDEEQIALADRWMSIDEAAKARVLYEKVFNDSKDAAWKQDATDRLFILGTKLADDALIAKTLAGVSPDLKKDHPELVLLARVNQAKEPQELDAIIADAANVQNRAPGMVFYMVGREIVKKANNLKRTDENGERIRGRSKMPWFAKADECFKNAIVRDSGSLPYRIADIATLEAGNSPTSVEQAFTAWKETIREGAGNLPKQDQIQQGQISPKEMADAMNQYAAFNLANAFELVPGGNPMEVVYKSHARALKFQIMKSSCSCHARSMKKSLAQEPGVIFTAASKDDHPFITVVYDDRKNNAKKLMNAKIIGMIKDPVEQRSDEAIASFRPIEAMVVEQDEARSPIQIKHNLAIEVPSETSGKVAQTSDEAVR